MSTALATLRTNDIHTNIKCLRDVLRVSDHLTSISISIGIPQLARLTFMTRIPALWSFSTTSVGGTPTAQTKSFAFSSMMTLMRSSSWPLV
jgi:hypothetical protein